MNERKAETKGETISWNDKVEMATGNRVKATAKVFRLPDGEDAIDISFLFQYSTDLFNPDNTASGSPGKVEGPMTQ